MGNLGVMVIFLSLAFINIFQRKRFREIVNQIYYEEPRFAAIELAQLFINSTIGVAGLMDCAKECFWINNRYADLGQTLRPTTYIGTSEWFNPISVGLYVHEKVNDTSFHLGEYEMIKEAAIDPYVVMRDIHVQYCMKLVE